MKTVSFQAKDKGARETKKKLDAIEDEAEIAQTTVLDTATMTTAGVRKTEGNQIRNATAPDVQFPTTFQSHDRRDQVMATKLALANERGVTPFGELIASDADFDWVERKRAEEEEANFQAWFAANYDRQAPHIKAMAHKLFPNFYTQRMKLLEKNVRMQQRIAELKLNGIQSKEDLYLQYAIESGLIPADPLENILHPEKAVAAQTKDARQKQFRRGLLNPRAWGSGSQGARIPKSNAEILLSETKGGVDAWKLGHTVDGTKHGFSIENFPNYNEMSKLFGKQQVVTRGLGKYTPGSTATTSSGGTGGTAQPLIPGL